MPQFSRITSNSETECRMADLVQDVYRVRRLSFSQKEGLSLSVLARSCNRVDQMFEQDRPSGIQFAIRGDTREIAAILGSIRPIRLLSTFNPRSCTPIERRDKIISIEPAGSRLVASLSTSSGTYFTDGYGSHNTEWSFRPPLSGSRIHWRRRREGCALTEIINAAAAWRPRPHPPRRLRVHFLDFREDVLRAFLGSVAFRPLPGSYAERRRCSQRRWRERGMSAIAETSCE